MRRLLIGLCLLVGAAAPAPAATVPYRTDGDLVALSDRVVRGRVVDSVVAQAPGGAIQTHTRVAVLEDFAGGGAAILTVVERGGRLPDGRMLWIPGTPAFLPGEEVVLCLQQRGAVYRTVALAYSAFRVGPVVLGRRTLRRFASNLSVVGRPAEAPPARTLAEFARVAASLTGAPARAVLSEADAAAAVAAAAGRAPSTEPFTLLGGGIRWRQADNGTPVLWYRNTLTPSPIQGADTDTEIRAALQGWTAPAGANITLTFGGTRLDPLEADADPYCTTQNVGAGMITFGDPGDELSPGVLAIGGGCGGAPLHVVNGTTFASFTHGLVVMNDDLSGYTTAPNVTRVLEHEIGHGIGLGHTCEDDCEEADAVNIMFPACCFDGAPIPPALGPDDLAGVVFIYPVPQCTFTMGPPTEVFTPASGGSASAFVTASLPTCTWSVTSSQPWVIPVNGSNRQGSGEFLYRVEANLANPLERTATLTVGQATFTARQGADVDLNADGIYEHWATFYGLTTTPPTNAGPSDDPDSDGVTNLAEQAAGSHPRGFHKRYLAEGVGNAFFDTELALFNPADTAIASVAVRVQPQGAPGRTWPISVGVHQRRTVSPAALESLSATPFSILAESDLPVVVDRTVKWDASGYGAHAETAVAAPSTTWYLAEGSTSGDFVLFYLLQNPGETTASATVRYLLPGGRPSVIRTYAVGPGARVTIPVDTVAPELASTDVSAVVTATQPIVVERAMYLSRPGQPFVAGHASAGVTTPATSWFLAEGATGSFFDLFILIANPGSQAAAVAVDYLLPSGATFTKTYTVAANGRFTIYVDDEQIPAGTGQRPLASTSVAMQVTSTNGVPIIVERAMWWPQPVWYEAHNAAGTTVTGTRWALAAGETGGANATETYILIANTGGAGTARVTLYFEDGTADPAVRTFALPASSRTNIAVSTLFPAAVGRKFSAVIESIGTTPVPIVVERAIYDTVNGVTWSAGTAAVATRLTP